MREDDGRKLDHKSLETLRVRAVGQVEKGARVEDVAAALGLSRSSVFKWVVAAEPDAGGVFLVTQTRARAIHADPGLMVPGTQHIDAHKWRPLVLNFRHYFGLGEEVGENFKTPTPSNPAVSRAR